MFALILLSGSSVLLHVKLWILRILYRSSTSTTQFFCIPDRNERKKNGTKHLEREAFWVLFLFNFLWIYWVFNQLIGSENLRCADVNWDRLVVCGGGFGPFGAMVFVSGLLGWMGCVRVWGFALLGLRVGRRRRCGFQRHQVSGRDAAVPPLCVIRWEYSRFAFCQTKQNSQATPSAITGQRQP